MILPILAMLALCAVPSDDPIPAPAVVSGFAPAEGARGTVIEVTGENFGVKRPRAWLEPTEGGKKRRLRVTAFTEDQLSLQLRAAKLPAGEYAVVIDPRGKDVAPVVAATPFVVRLARVDRFEPSFVTDQTEVDLVGEHFGSLGKPRVRIDGRRAKVLAAADGRLTVRLPKKSAGDTEVWLRTGAGEADGPCTLYVHGTECKLVDGLPDGELFCPTVADDFVFLDIDGHDQWALAPAFDARFDDDGTRLVAQTVSIKDASGYPAYLRVEFLLQPGDDKTPIAAAALESVSYTVFDGSPKGQQWQALTQNDAEYEWKSVHCFSYAHVAADLHAVDDGLPTMLRALIILRFDTMGLLAAEAEQAEEQEAGDA